MDVIVIGGGWGGVAAALEAASLKAETLLLERTDMLLGTGLVGGIMRNNGRFTAAEEMICLGGGKLFSLIDENLRHRNISFPGHEHACLYDVALLPPKVKPFLEAHGVKARLGVRINGACARNGLVSNGNSGAACQLYKIWKRLRNVRAALPGFRRQKEYMLRYVHFGICQYQAERYGRFQRLL